MISTKEEKSSSQQALPSIETLYKTVHNLHNEWGMDFYRVTPKYFDPLKDKQNKTGAKQNNIRIKHGKRGHFLDEIAKQSCTPAPNKYNTSPNWSFGGKLKNPRVLIDRNYAQQIVFQQKKHKSPAPNAYNIVPTTQQAQAKLRKIKERKTPMGSDRLSFLNTVQYKSLNSPGPGNYNPHIISSQKQNHFTPEQMIEKNKQRQKKIKQRFSKSTGFNYNPVVKNSFAQRQLFPKHYTENNATIYKKDWKPKKTLSKSICIVPGANYYKVTQDWSSKSGIFKSLSNYKSNVSVYR